MSAMISHDGLYRYRLERRVADDSGITIAYFGVNPSTADAEREDATTRRWKTFTRSHGGDRYIVGNVFAYRATDVRELAGVGDPIGQRNDAHVDEIIADADLLVPCWGAVAKVPRRLRHYFIAFENRLRSTGKPIRIFGQCACGSPRHPVRLASSTRLVEWVRS